MSEVVKLMPPPVATPMEMIDRALSGGASVDVIDKLMTLHERWLANVGRAAFDQAVASAKAEIPPIIKNRKVDFTTQKGRTHYVYEDLAEVSRTVDPILSRYGLSYRFRTTQNGRDVTVTCILAHRDGHSEETTLVGPVDDSGNKNPIQGIGSAVTFLQRYTLKAALGLAASVDDDARTPKAPEKINADQFVVVQNLIEEASADESKLLAFLGAASLEELTVKQFDTAVSALRKKIAQKGAA